LSKYCHARLKVKDRRYPAVKEADGICAASVTLEVNNNNMHLKFSDFAAAARFVGRQ
jgi:hypothetical protein